MEHRNILYKNFIQNILLYFLTHILKNNLSCLIFDIKSRFFM